MTASAGEELKRHLHQLYREFADSDLDRRKLDKEIWTVEEK